MSISMNRRDWLKASSLIAMTPSIPLFLRTSLQAAKDKQPDQILVVVQLSGGNDGINTVVPYTDEGYAQHRRELRLPTKDLIKINDEIGLHPAMRAMSSLFEQGHVAIVQGVGYPNPNRSHDVSMAIWQTARMDETQHQTFGWIGRSMDSRPSTASPQTVLVDDQAPPVAIRGRKSAFTVMDRLTDLQLHSKRAARAGDAADDRQNEVSDTNLGLEQFIRRTTLDAYATADLLTDVIAKSQTSNSKYPGSELGRRLKMISQLIKADFGTSVYYVSQSGYDTHSMQLPAHERLLRELSNGLGAFMTDLKEAGLDDRVAVICFSEFGRPVVENASLGTDHGAAGPVFVVGSKIKGGLYGTSPSLTDLDDNAPKMNVDFRQVYATLLDRWLNVPAQTVLDGKFDPVDFLSFAV